MSKVREYKTRIKKILSMITYILSKISCLVLILLSSYKVKCGMWAKTKKVKALQELGVNQVERFTKVDFALPRFGLSKILFPLLRNLRNVGFSISNALVQLLEVCLLARFALDHKPALADSCVGAAHFSHRVAVPGTGWRTFPGVGFALTVEPQQWWQAHD